MLERLQKIIARAGVASRRHAEQLILSGQVTVNGKTVTELGTKADSERDHIKVMGKLVQGAPREKIYVLLHKPAGVVATMSDPEGRQSLRDFLHGIPGRVYPVGRLEYHTSGLVLLTNDGDLASRILRAHSLPQTYAIKVKGQLNPGEMAAIETETGIRLRPLGRAANAWYEATMTSARRDRLRKVIEKHRHPIEKMRRSGLGNLELESLVPGQHRLLNQQEVADLERAVKKAVEGRTGKATIVTRSKSAPHPPSAGSYRRSGGQSGGRSRNSGKRKSK
jgi:23S rRNA pseudouridine2605 synthase